MGDLAPPASELFTRNLAPPGVTVNPVGGQATSLSPFGVIPAPATLGPPFLGPLVYGSAEANAFASNDVVLTAFISPGYFTPKTIDIQIVSGTAANWDVGIYTYSETTLQRLWHLGSTSIALAATSVPAPIASGAPTTLTLAPGTYYLGIANDKFVSVIGSQLGAGDKFPYGVAWSVPHPSGPLPLASSYTVSSLTQSQYCLNFSIR